MACRLIPLDKEPGLRPSDVGYFIINIILTEAHCSYFLVDFQVICSYFTLATTVK